MFIEQVRDFGFELNGLKITDAKVFRVFESLSNFWDGNKKLGVIYRYPDDDGNTEILCPSYMPCENLCLSFNDAILWILENKFTDSNSDRLLLFRMFWKINMEHEDGPILKKMSAAVIKKTTDGFSLKFCGGVYEPRKFRSDFRRAKGELEEGLAVQGAILVNTFLTLLSCKNVRTKKNIPDIKVQRKRARKNKPPLVSWYTLELQGFSISGSSSTQGLWFNRLHFCRGHVREYAPPGLFGKYVGRFWIAPHFRGNRVKGEIHKDYDLSKISLSANKALETDGRKDGLRSA